MVGTQLAAVVKKEIRQTFRDRRMAGVLIVAPILQLTLLGYAVDLEVRDVPTVIVDHDHTLESRELARGLLADGTLVRVSSGGDPERPIARGEASAVVVLPSGLGRDLAGGRPVRVQVLLDGTDPVRGQVVESFALRYFQGRALELARRKLARAASMTGTVPAMPTVQVVPRILYNPRLKSPIYMVPGVVAMVLLIVTTLVTAMGIAREREMGTIEQLLITPIRPAVLLLGKIIPFAVIGLVVAGLVLTIGGHLFDVPLRGPLWVIFVAALLFLMNTLGTGIFISTIARTQQQAILGGFFFIMPAILLSGFMTPVENMPDWIRPITYINPARYFLEILRAVELKGASIEDVWTQMAALLVCGVLLLTVSSLRFRKRIA
jgi:ABC-2 type transport system permease protein